MKLVKSATAGTMESSDIMIVIEPRTSGGIELELNSSVMQQYGAQIEAVIRETLSSLDVTDAHISAVDKGALDCTVRARVSAAVFRSAESAPTRWEGRE